MSSENPSFNPTGYLGTNFTNPGQNFFERRDPLPTDIHFPVGARWINTTSNTFWVLGSVVSKVANWIACGGGALAVDSLLLDDANTVIPISGVISLLGDSVQGVSTFMPIAGTAEITIEDSSAAQKGVVAVNSVVHGVLFGGATQSAINSSTAGLSGQVLQSAGAAADPVWSTATYPATTSAGEVLLSNVANAIISSNSLTGNFTFTGSTAGAARTVTVSQTDNTNAASHAIVSVQSGGVLGGDPKYQATIAATTWSFGADNTDTQSFVLSQNANLGTKNVFRSNVAGIIGLPLQSASSAYLSASVPNVTGDLTTYVVIFDVEDYDIQGEYNVATGEFKVTVGGLYQVTTNVLLYNLGAGHNIGNIQILVNGGSVWQAQFNPGASRESANQFSALGSAMLQLAPNDLISVQVQVGGSTKTVGVTGGGAGNHAEFQVTKIA